MSVRIAPYGTNGGDSVKYLNGELFGECLTMFCQSIIFCYLLFCLFELFKCPENATFCFKTYIHFC